MTKNIVEVKKQRARGMEQGRIAWFVVEGLSKADASFSNPTLCTLHSALIINTKNFTLAKFQPDCLWKMEINSLLLASSLDIISLTERCGNIL